MTGLRGSLHRLRHLGGSRERVRRNQATIAWAVAAIEARLDHLDGAAPAPDGTVRSELCTQAACFGPAYEAWCRRLGLQPSVDRWRWEKVYIARTLAALGVLEPGRRGLGFGVGGEPLVAYFAAEGCDVVATDLHPTDGRTAAWEVEGEKPGSPSALLRPDICPVEAFEQRVSLRTVDMAHIPNDLRDFDFCWSACALEHLGSLEAGVRFIEASLACLRPGGVAVHTTELNVGSHEETLEDGPIVLYRRRDLEALVARLERAGHVVAPLDLEPRHGVLDLFESDPPHLAPPALRVVIGGHVTTTVGLAVTRGK